MAADLQWHGDGDATGAGTGEKIGAGVLVYSLLVVWWVWVCLAGLFARARGQGAAPGAAQSSHQKQNFSNLNLHHNG